MKVLLEMRPALDGHAGIPQETRLLFRTLRTLEGVDAEGLIQHSGHVLQPGLPAHSARLPTHEEINRLSRVIISIEQVMGNPWLHAYFMACKHLLGGDQQLTKFDAEHFRDFIWRAMFARTLEHTDYDLVTRANFRVARVPWTAMHHVGLITKAIGKRLYPRINTEDFDVMIAETPYPARVSKRTKLIIRYHDAIPVLMPHTISDKRYHQASHYNALKLNVESGAYFSCVSEASRQDLLSMFPEAEPRATVIHNMISHHYFPEDSPPDRIPEILRTRQNQNIEVKRPDAALDTQSFKVPIEYLLMVSTIEPRKNHATLVSAWEHLRSTSHPELKLVIVGSLGWDHASIVKKMKPWVERGEIFMLEDVPSPELRQLYRHAQVTVCPSFGEGFDFSGVEAMRCGGSVAASDIAVHREIYKSAASFFSPYSMHALVHTLSECLECGTQRLSAVSEGLRVSANYLPTSVESKWRDYILERASEIC